HLGLLRPERCEGGHRTVYAGRREADVVMTSIWRRPDKPEAAAGWLRPVRGTHSRSRRQAILFRSVSDAIRSRGLSTSNLVQGSKAVAVHGVHRETRASSCDKQMILGPRCRAASSSLRSPPSQ